MMHSRANEAVKSMRRLVAEVTGKVNPQGLPSVAMGPTLAWCAARKPPQPHLLARARDARNTLSGSEGASSLHVFMKS